MYPLQCRDRMLHALVTKSRSVLNRSGFSSLATQSGPRDVTRDPFTRARSPRVPVSRSFTSNTAEWHGAKRPHIDYEPKKAKLVLDDGTELEGYSFGADTSMCGEVCFNTGMVGYPESLTDPSYCGQILTFTFPLIGNYGVPPSTTDNYGLNTMFESDKIHVRGVIVENYSHEYSHWRASRSLSDWLKDEGVPGIYGIDTRMLTKKIREHGVLLGKIVVEGQDDVPLIDPLKNNLIAEVSTKEIQVYGKGVGDVNILAVDCGIKHSIIRALVKKGAVVTVVPWDYPIDKEIDNYDALFLSNGPGDPRMAQKTVDNVAVILQRDENIKPVFGICMGNQLISMAVGAKAQKMAYGHRGHNQPCIDETSGRCYITSQNHGYYMDTENISDDWKPYFVNANDGTSEGIIHNTKPFFCVQFHPEARGGPLDTDFLFDRFLNHVRTYVGQASENNVRPIGEKLTKGDSIRECINKQSLSLMTSMQTAKIMGGRKPQKILILGSGGLQIGQAGEFDYSGSQAIKAVKEEGIESVLINPNIATVQTAKGLADKVYFLPVTPEFVEAIIEKEKPDGLFLQFGGQTALNCGVALHNSGVLAKHNVQVLGTSVETIVCTEDREEFANKLTEIDEPIATSVAVSSVADALYAADQIGYPVIGRAAFSLGGLGSGFAYNREELEELVEKALSSSPQILIEKSMKGWKEVEYEVVRDSADNCITVCNMENFDPLGIHTGDSIVIAPSQTLDDIEYQMLRTAAIRIVRHLGVVGECNVQYALHATSLQYCVIEVNPRLSRSSALASKATGYPLAFIAAKIALGYLLPDLRNSITRVTSACFEPSLDYCVTKIPRWDVRKFQRVNPVLGSAMKSVGEVMAIGRSWEESMQKALRMVDSSVMGFQSKKFEDHDEAMVVATDQRVFAIGQAFEAGYSVDKIHDMTKIDKWWLAKLYNIHCLKVKLASLNGGTSSPEFERCLRIAKKYGFSDEQIASCLNEKGTDELVIRSKRKALGIVPYNKQIDTLAAEYPAQTNYLYMTYNAMENDVQPEAGSCVVLGGGSYCIGNSVEFDYTAVSCIRNLRKHGERTTMINYNPETVSTDYDESDRLYFEELSFERVLDICDVEKPKGVVVSVGGQIPNNLVMPISRQGVPILGTPPDKIDNAEDRNKFSDMCDRIGVDQPQWTNLTSLDQAYEFADNIGYPVLVRPSYVLSGAAMKVCRSADVLESFLAAAVDVSKEHPVVISKFITGAKEIEMDGVGNKGEIVVSAIHEHIENAGVHSGDASLVFPSDDLPQHLKNKVYENGQKVVEALNISGPFNCQFIVDYRDDTVKIIECNVRASRSFPFVSKILGVDFIEQAVLSMLGKPIDERLKNLNPEDADFVGVKVPNFSFTRLPGADPITGVEMASTGEVACYGDNKYEAFLKAMVARNFRLPGKNILLMTGEKDNKDEFLPSAVLLQAVGYQLFAPAGTHAHLLKNGVTDVTRVTIEKKATPSESSVYDLFKAANIDLVINFPTPPVTAADEKAYEKRYLVRRSAIDFSIPVIHNMQVATMLTQSLARVKKFSIKGGEELTHPVDRL